MQTSSVRSNQLQSDAVRSSSSSSPSTAHAPKIGTRIPTARSRDYISDESDDWKELFEPAAAADDDNKRYEKKTREMEDKTADDDYLAAVAADAVYQTTTSTPIAAVRCPLQVAPDK